MFIRADRPALVLAPMDGITDPFMRGFLTTFQPFTYCVTEFLRVNHDAVPHHVIKREMPELSTNGRTQHGVPVQLQLLGGDPRTLAETAFRAVTCGVEGIDINFGCPAPTVNRHDGGATLLKYPDRIEAIVRAVRSAVPSHLPVSAKLRLGWENPDSIFENAVRAEAGGASWITVHGRTKMQGYTPPAYWDPIGKVQALLRIPVVVNGEIWTPDDLRRAASMTGCRHFMVGRGALARPWVIGEMARVLGIASGPTPRHGFSWKLLLHDYFERGAACGASEQALVARAKQWLKLAERHAGLSWFDLVKRSASKRELLTSIPREESGSPLREAA